MLLSDAVGLQGKEKVTAVIGAGGKTTFLFQLGKELKAKGKQVLLTTTTQMFLPGGDEVDSLILLARNGGSSLERSLSISPKKAKMAFLAAGLTENNKVKGISPVQVKCIKEKAIFSSILVEADGSRRKPLKSYASYEPNLPDCSDLVVVMAGADALNKPLEEKYIHRCSVAVTTMNLLPGSGVGVEQFARFMEQGAEKARAQAVDARIVAFINQVDNKPQEQVFYPLISRLLRNKMFNRIVVGSCRNPERRLETFY